METHLLSREAYERLQAELDDLVTRGRIEVASKIERARELGDLSENGDYHAAKDEQGHMEGRIRQLESLLDSAEIVEAPEPGVVGPGTIVTIVYDGDAEDDAERYLVGHIEERSRGLDVISPTAPLGAALLGARAGDTVAYEAPNGELPRPRPPGGHDLSRPQRAVLALALAVVAAAWWLRRHHGPISHTSRAARNAAVARLGVAVGTTYATTEARKLFASVEGRAQLDDERRLRTAEQVAERLGGMKGALMKVGQMASYVDDGLPEPVRQALATLQAEAPPMSADLAAEVVERELGRAPDELFVEWDPEPIAAASIGQVHRAVAVDPQDGRERAVAVKVQYPGVADAIDADLANTELLGSLLRQGFSGLDPSDMVAEIKERITEELDYRREAANQTHFATFYRGHPFFSVPAVLPELSTRRVLTSELVVGATWRELLTWDQHQRDLAGEGLFRFVFRSLYRMRAFNGDPHPGNYVFHGDGRITFLDFGLVRYFSEAETATFAAMVKAAAIDHDAAEFRRIVERAGLLPRWRPGTDGGGRRLLRPVLRAGRRGPGDALDEGLRQRHRAPHVRSHEPDRPVRHRPTIVRVHPAHQPGPVRLAGRSGRVRQLPAHGRGAVAVRRRPAIDTDGPGRGRVAGPHPRLTGHVTALRSSPRSRIRGECVSSPTAT